MSSTRTDKVIDEQTVEILGRNRLVNELLEAGLEVALPLRDRGVDLVAYADMNAEVASFSARPIQMKAATAASFAVLRKYKRFANLILTYVWYVTDPSRAVTYALTFDEANQVAEAMGWTRTTSWANGGYATNSPGGKLLERLNEFQMTPDKWWVKVTGSSRIPVMPAP